MRLIIIGAALAVCAFAHSAAHAQPGKTYPRVRTATGGFYGPTQANYQFTRRYGRPWRGDFPSNGSLLRNSGRRISPRRRFSGYGYRRYAYPGYYGYGNYFDYGYGLYGYPDYGTYSPYVPSYPVVIPSNPIVIDPDPLDNDLVDQDQQVQDRQRLQNLIPVQQQKNDPLLVNKSNAAARQRSLHQQGLGDFNMKERKFSKAYAHYRRAATAAPDLPANYFRMAWALAATGHYASAVREIKRGLRLDPYWPLTGESLDERFGFDNEIAKNNVLLQAAQWVRDDIRDPDRLFLMGALLHFNNDIDKALKFFETAGQLAGSPQHVQLFLHPQQPPKQADAADAGQPADAPNQPAPQQQPPQQPAPPQRPAKASPPPPVPEPEPMPVEKKSEVSGPVLPMLR